MFIIAEVGLAHDGSLQQAHSFIDACAGAGVDAVKFQCHDGDPNEDWRVRPYWCIESRQEYWRRTSFDGLQWSELFSHCCQAKVEFMCSVFSVEALKVIDPLVKRHKVPSGRIKDYALLDAIRETGKPVVLSTGMSTFEEWREAIKRVTFGDKQCDPLIGPLPHVQVLECVSKYPASAADIDLEAVARWGGLSDHSGTIWAGIAAASRWCRMLEVHVCWSKEQGNLDAAASLTIEQLQQLVEGVRFIEKAMQPVDKDKLAEELAETRRVFM